jgi:tetratricopeptide (TPR) repeat protein
MFKGQRIIASFYRSCALRASFIGLTLACLSGCDSDTTKAYAEAQRAEGLAQAGHFGAARLSMAKALSYRDDQLDLILLDGRIKMAQGDTSAAFDAYSLARAIDQSNQEALQAISQLGLAVGALDEAKAASDDILVGNPSSLDALLIKGVIALSRHNWAEAAALADQMMTVNPQDERSITLKARSLFLSDHRDEALTILRRAQIEKPQSIMIRTALLECARAKGDAPLMLEQIAALRRVKPNSGDLALDEINVRYRTGDTAGARAVAIGVLDKFGEDDDVLGRLITLWVENDATPLSEATIATLVTSGKADARLAVARRFLDQGNLAVAARLTANMTGGDAEGLAARIADAGGDRTALARSEAILKDDSTNCDALFVRARNRLAIRRPDEAVVAAQQIATECPDRNDGYLMLARAYQVQNRDTGVMRAFEQGVSQRPLDVALTTQFVEWLSAKGSNSRAIAVARRLTFNLKARPSAWQLLGRICAHSADAVCSSQAATGLAAAKQSFIIDLPPGTRQPNPLLGQAWR